MKRWAKHLLFFLIVASAILVYLEIMLAYNRSLQPVDLNFSHKGETSIIPYVDTDTVYNLVGEIECYPKVVISPNSFEPYKEACITINSLSEIRQDACIKGDTYMATIRFYINVPGDIPYAMIFPGSFCEYLFFANRGTQALTPTFRSASPVYASPEYIEIPYSSDGIYEIIMYVNTPVNSVSTSNDCILFGSRDKLLKQYNFFCDITLAWCALIIFTIIFCLIQYIAMRKDKILTSFILLSVSVLLMTLFKDNVVIMHLFPNLHYQLGTVLAGIGKPLFIIALVNYEIRLFPKYCPKFFLTVTFLLQLLPLFNSFTLNTYPVLAKISEFEVFLPYAFCIWGFLRAHLNREKHTLIFGIALIATLCAEILYYNTSELAHTIQFTSVYGFVFFALLEMMILAERYSTQEKEERYYMEELNRTLEEMQDSENAFLNAQMKPHFLYNTLNTIADLCVTDPDRANNLIGSLKDYCQLILSIDNVEKTVSLAQEMELVNAYTAIEKERFPSVKFFTDFPIRMPKIQMPPLTLQPLIENAIKHGVRKSDKPGVITLRIRDTSENVTFYVSDNGVGMDNETIEKLFEEPKDNNSIGVYNIDKRLKNLFGTGLEVDSTIGLGTCVSFTVTK